MFEYKDMVAGAAAVPEPCLATNTCAERKVQGSSSGIAFESMISCGSCQLDSVHAGNYKFKTFILQSDGRPLAAANRLITRRKARLGGFVVMLPDISCHDMACSSEVIFNSSSQNQCAHAGSYRAVDAT